MTRSEPPLEPAVPEAAVRELQALYREAANEEPGPALDRRILDAARADLQVASPARRPQPWWRGWLPLTSALAVAAVGLSLTWRVMDQQERELREEMNAAAAADSRPAKAAPSAARPVLDAAQPQTTPAPAAQVGATRESPGAADSAPPATASAAAPAAPPAPVGEAVSAGQRGEPDALRERRDARLAAPAAPSAERQAGKLEATRPGSSRDAAAEAFAPPAANAVAGAATRAADQAADAATPELWLQQIRALRAAGRSAEAAQSLARFRARHPDVALPDDLRDLR